MRFCPPSRFGALLACAAAAVLAAFGEIAPQATSPVQPAGAGLSRAQMESFLVQSADAVAGGPPGGSLQAMGDPVVWRKHDWANRGDAVHRLGGYQASDSVLDTVAGHRLYVQTFDFGDGNRKFQRFDLRKGDGGQALVLVHGSAYTFMTEDGGGGVQWFVGSGCRSSTHRRAPFESWLFFDAGVTRRAWRDRVARLNIEPRLATCPMFFNDAYTRWRREDVEFPYQVSASGHVVRRGSWKVDTIVSEHYGGSSIATASHL
ncbi:MAG TPA: hypothetical protein VND97_04550, partial [Beijerinckiaceae bacterium]|nr:hypothetical protein [Beijerinckiaceae bacterium]